MQLAAKIIANILTDILTVLHQSFGFALCSALLLNFLYLYVCQPACTKKGIRQGLRAWVSVWKNSFFFRKLFFFHYVTMMIVFRTLVDRRLWPNPLSDVMGDWWIWEEVNGKLTLSTECFENLAMMIPFTFLLLWTFQSKLADHICKTVKSTETIEQAGNTECFRQKKEMQVMQNCKLRELVKCGLLAAFLFSFAIELLQLILRLGTWQMSDLVYNTLGGGIGGFLYHLFQRFSSKQQSSFAPM